MERPKRCDTSCRHQCALVMIRHFHLLMVVAVIATCETAAAQAEDHRWHVHSLTFYGAGVNPGITFDARNGYDALTLGPEAEYGLGYGTLLSDEWEMEFRVSKLETSGIQKNDPNQLFINSSMKFLWLTWKYRPGSGMAIPWCGGGIHAGVIENLEQERIQTDFGPINKTRYRKVSNAGGAHIEAGLDFYPGSTSAVALSLFGRYNLSAVSGPHKGDIDSYAVGLGLRWDFWQTAP